ncbi:MAG: uroporphyrinogen decarboxylase family protein [Candidatus Pacebacteria bacterium]|nr:uroporphyrinogen decarboxylase family protein [Candidatus Paceibacterota bacterium]
MTREPNFENLLAVLRREVPERPTLFEFFMNGTIYREAAGEGVADENTPAATLRLMIQAFRNLGYDYATAPSYVMDALSFPRGPVDTEQTRSLNQGCPITDRESFDHYDWPDPDSGDYSILDTVAGELPDGMKLVVSGPSGVLENVIALVGYDNLCYLTVDDPELVEEIFAAVGDRLVRFYRNSLAFDTVGAMISNDDWGFKTQTMLPPADMRRYVFPWHKRIVDISHAYAKPVILHSCGKFEEVFDDIVEDMKFDGRHSYEDAIVPVEEAYEKYGDRIAICGGIDVDFICRSTADQVYRRSCAMLERSAGRGGYALGTGNSVPEYVPRENYYAMVRAAVEA